MNLLYKMSKGIPSIRGSNQSLPDRYIFPTIFPEINATKLPQIDTTAVDHKSIRQDIDEMRKLAVITRENFQTVFHL